MQSENEKIKEQLQSAMISIGEVIPALQSAIQVKAELERQLADAETKIQELSSMIVD